MAGLEEMLLEAAGRRTTSGNGARPNKRKLQNVSSSLDGHSSDSPPSIRSDLYRDDSDREHLERMPELHREMILAERSTKLDDYNLRRKLARALSPPRPDHKMKPESIHELRAQRLKRLHHDNNTHRLPPLTDDDGSNSSDADDADTIPDDITDEPIDFQDVRDVTIRRSALAKWCTEPYFEDLIAGCFVRISIGRSRSGRPNYKLCRVMNVDATDPERTYKLEGRTTYKYLNCASSSSSARWQMAIASESRPSPDEFYQWLHETTRTGGKMIPTKQDLTAKKQEIDRIKSYVYSAATVKQMVEEKRASSSRPTNVAAEKDRLRKVMEAAEDGEEVERVRLRLKELEEMSMVSVDVRAVRISEMNRRNKAENFRNASESKPVNTSTLKAGEAGYDPFSRRWTRSSNYYRPKREDHHHDHTAVVDQATAAAGTTAQEVAAVEGKLVDTKAPVGMGKTAGLMNSMHDFELNISLAGLEKFGGASGVLLGFMARKQEIEAKVGVRVPPEEHQGKRARMALSISEYRSRYHACRDGLIH